MGIDEIFSDEASERETDNAFKQLRPKARVQLSKYVNNEGKRKAKAKKLEEASRANLALYDIRQARSLERFAVKEFRNRSHL